MINDIYYLKELWLADNDKTREKEKECLLPRQFDSFFIFSSENP